VASSEERVGKFLKRLFENKPALEVGQSLSSPKLQAPPLAREISLTSAISSNDFARAHQKLARGGTDEAQVDHG